ncbi:MAG TPA: biotin/lipoyl-binding protein, partial [Thermodesulfobacteriota bacterium]|nr:biotin/lipoyl-binding protein [Thermodesulfobacteriota bacterium]
MNLQDDAFGKDESRFTASSILWLIVASMAIFLIWSYFAVLDEVAIGEGKVTPASKGQIIQSLEGGILSELVVHEGDVVENGQKLATLDPALSRSSVEEAAQKIIALQARAARLRAEIENKSDIIFPPELADEKAVIERERQLFRTDVQAFHENVSQLSRQLRLAQQEIDIAMPLLKTGATNEVEILRLKQKAAELSTKLAATKGQYSVALKSDYATTMADLGPLLKVREGRADQLRRTVITSPTRGIVKDVRVNT